MEIRLGGRNFTIATDRQGNPLVATSSRPSQPVDGGAIQLIECRTDGHDLNSFDYIGPGAATGYLGRDYGVNSEALSNYRMWADRNRRGDDVIEEIWYADEERLGLGVPAKR